MLEALLRLIGIGGRREKRPPVDAEEEWRRAVREQWESLTPEERARSAEMERMLRNAEPRAYSPDQLRPMTEEELARYNDPERGTGVPVQLGEFSGIGLFGDATLPPGRIEVRRSKRTVLQSDPSIATSCQCPLLGEKSPRELPKG